MKSNKFPISTLAVALALSFIGLFLFGCSMLGKKGETETPAEKSGAQLWAENCNRCHNVRSPQSYSSAQWEVAMLHMRVRANLTPDEHKKILEFLKGAN